MIFAIALKQNQIWIERETYFSSSEVLEEDGGGHVNWSSTTTESTSDSPDGELETVFDRFFETGLVFGLCTERDTERVLVEEVGDLLYFDISGLLLLP